MEASARLYLLVPSLVLAFILFGCAAVSPPQLFLWHPVLLTASFVLGAPLGIYSITHARKGPGRAVQHSWVMLPTALCTLAGFGVIYYNKSAKGKAHFTTWHGTFGVLTVLFTALQLLGGLRMFFPQSALLQVLLTNKTYLKVKPALSRWHGNVGVLCYYSGICTVVLGLFSKWFVGTATAGLVREIALLSAGLVLLFSTGLWNQ